MHVLRTTTKLLPLVALLFAFGACNEDEFLTRTPLGRYTPANFYSNQEQFIDATNTLYPLARGLHTGGLFTYGEFRSDNTTFEFNPNDRGRNGTERIDYFLLEATDGLHNAVYNSPYTGIARANYILAQIDDVEFTFADGGLEPAERREAAAGEAFFFRGYFHSLLTQHFGDIVTTTEIVEGDGTGLAQLRRQPADEAYDNVIIPDLERAIDLLPDDWDRDNTGRVTSHVARMALAKAHFARRDYAAALPLLEAIINSGQYQLMDDYRSVFFTEQRDNPEILWAAQYNAGAGQGSTFMRDWIPQSGMDILIDANRGGAGFNIPTCSLIDAYEDGDARFAATIAFYDEDEDDPDNEVIPYSVKYLEVPFPVEGGVDVDYPIFRYAEVLLMYAEALVEVNGGLPNEAFTGINSLRARAGLGFYFPGNPNPALNIETTEQLREAIRQERRVELAYEGKRSYDLRRYGTFVETMLEHGEVQKVKQAEFLDELPEAYTNIRELLAIPQGQIDLYQYRQNPGWE